MEENNIKTSISKASTLGDIADFWDNNSLADYWDETKEVKFNIRAKRRNRVTIDPDIFVKVSTSSQRRGILPETLINLWLAEKIMSEISIHEVQC
ncbi:hypothetical protein MHK_010339 [Candidatus Magnetomorum sp. HK-1]|nr:hypothetical protein MHK_010339 [Candidatus Magnetomorum sp. HK-1]